MTAIALLTGGCAAPAQNADTHSDIVIQTSGTPAELSPAESKEPEAPAADSAEDQFPEAPAADSAEDQFPEAPEHPGPQAGSPGPEGTFPEIPPYEGRAYAVLDDNIPDFTEEEITDISFEYYSDPDELGRCGAAFACIGRDLMPETDREPIGSVKPTGWHLIKYDCIEDLFLYNRCHLIGFQLTGENANEKNLITGTRYMNVEGMLPFENIAAEYVRMTGFHVMYRVTPVFSGSNLLADGVRMEALSVEDGGAAVCFDVFCYNIQPGIIIDYTDGSSCAADPGSAGRDDTVPDEPSGPGAAAGPEEMSGQDEIPEGIDYILNTNTMKFHLPSCESAKKISGRNRREFSGSREELISQGYSPCGVCDL